MTSTPDDQADRSSLLAEMVARQATLTRFGLLLLVLLVVAVAAEMVDPRMIAGVSVWAKPAKFLLSVAVFALTMAWTFGYVRPERRRSRAMRWMVILLIASGSFELSYICWQAAHGLESHFNRSTPFYSAMYAAMGVGAALLVGTTLPMAWELGRRPITGLRADYRAAVVMGLVMCFVLGGGLGFFMAQGSGHSIGAVGGHAPLFGWNRCGGDLRIAHFLGIHAQQAIPLIAIVTGGLAERWRWAALVGGAGVYAIVTSALLLQAVSGAPFLPWLEPAKSGACHGVQVAKL